MSKIIAAKKKIARRLGVDLHGEHRSSRKKKPYLPGMHGPKLIRRASVYSSQLKAKQILRSIYALTEKSFRIIVLRSFKTKGNTVKELVSMLESRLDSIVYRAGFAISIYAAKQLVSHGHVEVNGKRVNISSFRAKPGDVISLRGTARRMEVVTSSLSSAASVRTTPSYIEVDNAGFIVKYLRKPEVEEVPYDCEVNFPFIVEYYSR